MLGNIVQFFIILFIPIPILYILLVQTCRIYYFKLVLLKNGKKDKIKVKFYHYL